MFKIKELKKLKDSQLKKRAERDFEEKLLIAGVKDKPMTVHSAKGHVSPEVVCFNTFKRPCYWKD